MIHSEVVEPPDKGPIMVIAAHPDDMESWCAGTLARSIDKDVEVKLLLVTSGDKGSSDATSTSETVARQREAEAREAAELLGICEVSFLRYSDGEVEETRTLRGELVEAIRSWRPLALFTHDPENPYPPYLSHRDHRIVGRAALDAAYPLARDRLSFPGQLESALQPHSVSQLWLFSTTSPNAYVDITAGMDKKIAARLAHRSQTSDPVGLATNWRKRAEGIGAQVGLPLAEAFVILHLD